jgi:hypothetical protein
MYKKDPNGRKIKVQTMSKENVDELLKRYGIVLENKFGMITYLQQICVKLII